MKKPDDNKDRVRLQTNVGKRENNKDKLDKLKNWFKKLGLIGFLIFLIKGLLWIIIPYLMVVGIFD